LQHFIAILPLRLQNSLFKGAYSSKINQFSALIRTKLLHLFANLRQKRLVFRIIYVKIPQKRISNKFIHHLQNKRTRRASAASP
jgi:hypothetical protein